ncbi:uncharacterized protein J3D65DRAFT_618718 [Phyllosticta citribraziliensis]|uniref:Uncharacterized protein n=1 Tax=Phyllosticta citribraziliensis TaxID=989973 RepID=A0ABR1LW93_9PEZI
MNPSLAVVHTPLPPRLGQHRAISAPKAPRDALGSDGKRIPLPRQRLVHILLSIPTAILILALSLLILPLPPDSQRNPIPQPRLLVPRPLEPHMRRRLAVPLVQQIDVPRVQQRDPAAALPVGAARQVRGQRDDVRQAGGRVGEVQREAGCLVEYGGVCGWWGG